MRFFKKTTYYFILKGYRIGINTTFQFGKIIYRHYSIEPKTNMLYKPWSFHLGFLFIMKP